MINLIRQHRVFFLLALVFFLALFLRLYQLGALPANFHEDEVLSGYLGRFILQNGKDLYGNPWPLLYFNKFGDFYIILPMYLSGIATYFFGINEFATRFPAAFFGSLAVIPVFFLALKTFKNQTVALIAAFFSAILPWHIVLARSTAEGVIGSSIFLFGIAFLLHAVEKQNYRRLIIACFLFFVSYFIYHPFRLYTPLIFLPLFFLYRRLFTNKRFFFILLLANILFFSLSFYISSTPWGKGRFVQTSIFSPLSGVDIRNQELIFSEKNNNVFVTRIFHNKLFGYTREGIHQYLNYFSPVFLTINGWEQSKYYIPEQGPVYFIMLVFLLFSFIPLKTKAGINNNYIVYMIFLTFLAPLPAAFTVAESPSIHRTTLFSYFLVIFMSYGFYKALFIKYKRLSLAIIFIFILSAEFIYFWHQYGIHADTNLKSSLVRNTGQKEVGLLAKAKEQQYDEIILPVEGAMAWYYLFFNRDFNPVYATQFRLDARIDKTNKVRYIENSCPSQVLSPDILSKKIIIIDRHQCPNASDKVKQIGTIKGTNELIFYKIMVPN